MSTLSNDCTALSKTELSPALPTTRQRLGAVAASNKRYAAHGSLKFALPLLRASAAIAPNRMLAEVHLSISLSYYSVMPISALNSDKERDFNDFLTGVASTFLSSETRKLEWL